GDDGDADDVVLVAEGHSACPALLCPALGVLDRVTGRGVPEHEEDLVVRDIAGGGRVCFCLQCPRPRSRGGRRRTGGGARGGGGLPRRRRRRRRCSLVARATAGGQHEGRRRGRREQKTSHARQVFDAGLTRA